MHVCVDSSCQWGLTDRALLRNPNKALLTLSADSCILIANEIACNLFNCQV